MSFVYNEPAQNLEFHVNCTLAYETSANMNIADNPQPWVFGNQYYGPEGTAYEGSLDEIYIFNRVLFQAELQAFCAIP